MGTTRLILHKYKYNSFLFHASCGLRVGSSYTCQFVTICTNVHVYIFPSYPIMHCTQHNSECFVCFVIAMSR